MPKTFKILNQTFTANSQVKQQIHNYLILIDENYDPETAKDLKASLVDNLTELADNQEITAEIFQQVVTRIGSLEKPIYKSFFRYRGLFGGVCDGIATYFNISIWWPRLVFGFPFIFGFLLFLDTFSNAIISGLPYYENLFWNRVYIGDGYTDYGYHIKPIAETLFNLSIFLIITYILTWFFVPEAATEFEVKQLKSKWEYSDELEKSIFNRITFKNQFLRKITSKVFLNIAKFGIFIFDVTLSIINGISKSVLFKLLKFIIVLTLILVILINLYIAIKPN